MHPLKGSTNVRRYPARSAAGTKKRSVESFVVADCSRYRSDGVPLSARHIHPLAEEDN